METDRSARVLAVAGMAASAIWVVALIAEYGLGLRPLANASDGAYQVVFLIAQVGYVALLVGMYRSQAGGPGQLGRAAIGVWVIALGEVVVARAGLLLGFDTTSWLPGAAFFQLVGSVLTSVAVLRGGRWTGWRRFAPAIWTGYFLVRAGAVIAGIPVVSDSVSGHRVPSVLSETVLHGLWFLLALAFFVEAGRRIPKPAPAPAA